MSEHNNAWLYILQPCREPQRWSPHRKGWIKCNFDVVIKENKVVLAAVDSDDSWSILKAWVKEESVGSSEWAEAKATLFAVTFARLSGFRWLVLEGDNLTVINALKSIEAQIPWAIRPMVEHAKATGVIFILERNFVKREYFSLLQPIILSLSL